MYSCDSDSYDDDRPVSCLEICAGVVELADALRSGRSGLYARGSSSLPSGTRIYADWPQTATCIGWPDFFAVSL